jgi:uncharacterized protein DUF3359
MRTLEYLIIHWFNGRQTMNNKLTKIFALALVLGFTGGCADMTQMDAIKATANAALAEAQSASAQANNAMNVASEAAYAASQAQADATAALECCNDNSARMDRMFEKAMMK